MNISDFLKSNLTINDYAKLFNTYNIERGADGYENTYDLNDFESFGYFVQLYNTPIAMKCKNKNRFWIGGLNFDEPREFPTTIDGAKKLIDGSIEEDRFLDNIGLYADFISKQKLVGQLFYENYLPNENTMIGLNYSVVLQHFTIACYKLLWETELIADNISFEDFLAVVSNLAYVFTRDYEHTEWKTSFEDYMHHFIAYHLTFDGELLDIMKNVDSISKAIMLLII